MELKELIFHPGYAISDEGDVVNLKNGRKLKGSIDKKGYLKVTIGGDGLYVHRLAAEYFVENPNGFRYVIHIDGNRVHNDKTNLIWSNKRSVRNE